MCSDVRGFLEVSSLMDYMLGIVSSSRAKKLTKPLLKNILDNLNVEPCCSGGSG